MNRVNFVNRERCPACSANDLRTIFQSPFNKPPIRDYLESFYSPQGKVEFEFLEGATFFLCKCNVCGLIFQREIPDDSLMEKLYEHWIDPQKVFNQHLEQAELEYYSSYAQEIMQLIAFFEKVPSSLSFLDFGMGWGRWALMAKAFGLDSYGYEVSKERILFAQSNGVKVVSWEEMTQRQFDFINAEQIFEHIPQPLLTLCHLKKVLKPNGILKISVPTANDIERRLKIMDWKSPKGTRNSLNPIAPLEHINFFRRASLDKMAHAAGMEEVRIPLKYQYMYRINWYGVKQIAKNILAPIYQNIFKSKNYIFLRNAQ